MLVMLMGTKDTSLPLAREWFTCPTCQAGVVTHFDAWERADDGRGWLLAPEGVHLECMALPSCECALYTEWFDEHYANQTYHTYTQWVGLEARARRWVNARYRWDVPPPPQEDDDAPHP